MTTVLITAFEPYDPWPENSSWLTLVELTKDLPQQPVVKTRRYPVHLDTLRQRLAGDLQANYDYVVHLGQSPGRGRIELETLCINVAGDGRSEQVDYPPLVADGPLAYRCRLPLADWAAKLRHAGIPCQVSYQSGTYLCNAAFYLSHYYAQQRNLTTQPLLIHLPLEMSQAVASPKDMPALPAATLAAAIRLILLELAEDDAEA
jgi:pyroglutamyl-peptidase